MVVRILSADTTYHISGLIYRAPHAAARHSGANLDRERSCWQDEFDQQREPRRRNVCSSLPLPRKAGGRSDPGARLGQGRTTGIQARSLCRKVSQLADVAGWVLVGAG